jgi:hypothetical protein
LFAPVTSATRCSFAIPKAPARDREKQKAGEASCGRVTPA